MKRKSILLGLGAFVALLLCLGACALWARQQAIGVDVHALAKAGRSAALRETLRRYRWLGIANRQDSAGRSPLHYAADGETVRCLVEYGAKLDPYDFAGRAPIHIVNEPTAVEELLKAGADPRLPTMRGLYSPLHTTVNYPAMTGHLSKDIEKEVGELPIPPPKWQCRKIELLLQYGAKINAKASMDETPLDLASSFDEGVIELLKKHGAVQATSAYRPK